MIAAGFLSELRADPRTASIEPLLKQALRALDLESDGNPDAALLCAAVEAVADHPASLIQKLRALLALTEIDHCSL